MGRRGSGGSTAVGGSRSPIGPRMRRAASPRAGSTTAAGPRSTCPAAGRCRASIARSTRTSRCRSRVCRPTVPDANPTGIYRTAFSVPRAWAGRRVVLHVGAADSVLFVWVNGHEIGLSKDSRLEAEFDVTDHVQVGSNSLAMMVVRWSDASYVEDQDQWWHAGITREVYLYATDRVYLADVQADARLDSKGSGGELDARVTVGFAGHPEPGWTVEARLETLGGRAASKRLAGEVPADVQPYLFSGHTVELHAALPKVAAWSAEQPNLYRLVVKLVDPSGADREVTAFRVGFRTVELGKRTLLINGKVVLLRGVNRHDFDRRTGRVVSEESMRADLVLMKQFGFNAVRTSHAPNDPRVLRPVRRDRPVRDRRGEHRDARVQHLALPRPALPRRVDGSRLAHGDPGQEPRVDHPLVARQRVGLRRASRCARRLDPQVRPHPTPALRGGDHVGLGARPARHGCPVPDVPGDRRHRRVGREGQGHDAADHVRVLARDGQQQRLPRRVLGRDRGARRAAGRVHLGVVGPRARAAAAGRHGAHRVRRRLRRPAERRELLHRRRGLAGPHAQAGTAGAPRPRAAGARRAARHSQRPHRDHEQAGLLGSGVAAVPVRGCGRRRGAVARRGAAARSRARPDGCGHAPAAHARRGAWGGVPAHAALPHGPRAALGGAG